MRSPLLECNHVGLQIPPSAPSPCFIPPPLPIRGFEPARGADEQEEEGDAREPVSPEPSRNGRSPGWAAPLPDDERSLGYPATNNPRGKAQAGKSPLRRHLTASPSSPAPPPAGRLKRTTVSLPAGARVGTDVGPMRCAPSVRPALLRSGPSPRASSGLFPRRRQAPPARTRDRSPLPSRPRRTASSPGASRHTGHRNRRSRFSARDVSRDQE